jgi:hypothetical protein
MESKAYGLFMIALGNMSGYQKDKTMNYIDELRGEIERLRKRADAVTEENIYLHHTLAGTSPASGEVKP